jgi:hypothetical protein
MYVPTNEKLKIKTTPKEKEKSIGYIKACSNV